MTPSFDWSQTTLGAREAWPQVLRTLYDTILRSPCPMVILWGTDGILLYNDGYAEIAGARHPQLLGAKVLEGWPEAADFNDQVLRAGLAGETLSFKDHEFTLLRHGAPERVWLNLDYSPIVGEQGEVLGVLAVLLETTQRVLSQRHREAAEADLKAERDRGRDVLDNMAEAFVLIDHEFRIADVNAEALRYSRKTRGELLGVNCWTAFPTIEPELRQTIGDALRERRAMSVEHLHRRANG